MFKLIGSLVRTVIFVLVIIIAGNLISWDGKSVNSRVMAQWNRISYFGFSKKAQKWAGSLAQDAQTGYQKSFEKISSSERQKLRALIEELNTSSSAPARH